MLQCISQPVQGFYMSPESILIFGSRRDLSTSPEISQTFGEVIWPGAIFTAISGSNYLLAIWLLPQYLQSGKVIPL